MWPDSKGRNIAFTPNSKAPRIWLNGSASGKINTGNKSETDRSFDLKREQYDVLYTAAENDLIPLVMQGIFLKNVVVCVFRD